MKGKVCSWRDMRCIKHILENPDRLKGELASLTACAGRTTWYDWEKAIGVMDSCRLSDTVHFQPTHAREIARHAPQDEWARWAQRCETERLTVAELRGRLLASRQKQSHEQAAATAPGGQI